MKPGATPEKYGFVILDIGMTNPFSFEQQSIIDGSLLGDGHLSEPIGGGNSYFVKNQSAKRRDYLQYHFDKLGGFSSSLNEYDNYANGKKYRKAVYLTHAEPVFTELRQKWYPHGEKLVPRPILMSPLTMAIWFFDDGSNHLPNRQCKFHTNAFTVEDCEYLCTQLEGLGIRGHVNKRHEIIVESRSYKDLIACVSPYMMWDCFSHKIRYRDPQLQYASHEDMCGMVEMYRQGAKLVDVARQYGKSLSATSAIVRGDRKGADGIATKSLNLNNSSGHKGVSWEKSRSKWKASIKVDGRTKNLGRFNTKEEAAYAVAQAISGGANLCKSLTE